MRNIGFGDSVQDVMSAIGKFYQHPGPSICIISEMAIPITVRPPVLSEASL